MNGQHMMLDFETLGQRPSTAVVSLGVVIFNKEGIVKTQDMNFNVDEQIKRGRTIDYSTVQWWMKQSEQARAVFQKTDGIPISRFDGLMTELFGFAGSDVQVRGNDFSFDGGILGDFYDRFFQKPKPWKFWNSRCFRTYDAIFKVKEMAVRKGTHHNALDDAIYQAECLIAHWRK